MEFGATMKHYETVCSISKRTFFKKLTWVNATVLLKVESDMVIYNMIIKHIGSDSVGQHQQFSSATVAIRAQKKIFSKIISRNNVKLFVDDATIRLFDHLYQILKTTYNKMIAEKVVKNIIKLIVKLGVVMRNEQLTIEQQNQLAKIQRQMRQLCLTVISFGRVAFSYDYAYLNALLKETYRRLLPLIEQILSGKSKQRLDMIFEHLCKDSVLDSLFRADGQHWKLLPNVVMDLEVLIDREKL